MKRKIWDYFELDERQKKKKERKYPHHMPICGLLLKQVLGRLVALNACVGKGYRLMTSAPPQATRRRKANETQSRWKKGNYKDQSRNQWNREEEMNGEKYMKSKSCPLMNKVDKISSEAYHKRQRGIKERNREERGEREWDGR